MFYFSWTNQQNTPHNLRISQYGRADFDARKYDCGSGPPKTSFSYGRDGGWGSSVAGLARVRVTVAIARVAAAY